MTEKVRACQAGCLNPGQGVGAGVGASHENVGEGPARTASDIQKGEPSGVPAPVLCPSNTERCFPRQCSQDQAISLCSHGRRTWGLAWWLMGSDGWG